MSFRHGGVDMGFAVGFNAQGGFFINSDSNQAVHFEVARDACHEGHEATESATFTNGARAAAKVDRRVVSP